MRASVKAIPSSRTAASVKTSSGHHHRNAPAILAVLNGQFDCALDQAEEAVRNLALGLQHSMGGTSMTKQLRASNWKALRLKSAEKWKGI